MAIYHMRSYEPAVIKTTSDPLENNPAVYGSQTAGLCIVTVPLTVRKQGI